ncbi:hypothetical protein, partial [Desulfobacula sp.]
MRVSAVQWKTFENFKKLFRHWTDKITWIVTGLWQMYKNLILMANIQFCSEQKLKLLILSSQEGNIDHLENF